MSTAATQAPFHNLLTRTEQVIGAAANTGLLTGDQLAKIRIGIPALAGDKRRRTVVELLTYEPINVEQMTADLTAILTHCHPDVRVPLIDSLLEHSTYFAIWTLPYQAHTSNSVAFMHAFAAKRASAPLIPLSRWRDWAASAIHMTKTQTQFVKSEVPHRSQELVARAAAAAADAQFGDEPISVRDWLLLPGSLGRPIQMPIAPHLHGDWQDATGGIRLYTIRYERQLVELGETNRQIVDDIRRGHAAVAVLEIRDSRIVLKWDVNKAGTFTLSDQSNPSLTPLQGTIADAVGEKFTYTQRNFVDFQDRLAHEAAVAGASSLT